MEGEVRHDSRGRTHMTRVYNFPCRRLELHQPTATQQIMAELDEDNPSLPVDAGEVDLGDEVVDYRLITSL